MIVVDIKAKIYKSKITLLHEGKVFLTLDRGAFASLSSKAENDFSKEDAEIQALINTYDRYKSKFYKRDVSKSITKSDKDYKYFREALAIIKRHDVECRTYIEAQIKGLEFANSFPKPSQLATTSAEERFMVYQRQVDVEGTQEQKDSDAEKYKNLSKKVKEGSASIKEVKFVARYERDKLGGIKSSTKAYLTYLKNK